MMASSYIRQQYPFLIVFHGASVSNPLANRVILNRGEKLVLVQEEDGSKHYLEPGEQVTISKDFDAVELNNGV